MLLREPQPFIEVLFNKRELEDESIEPKPLMRPTPDAVKRRAHAKTLPAEDYQYGDKTYQARQIANIVG